MARLVLGARPRQLAIVPLKRHSSLVFVLMGGLYWKRATAAGAVTSLWTGFIVQTGLVIFDLVNTAPMAMPYLESIHPVFMGHGVIVAMLISGSVFVCVSLVTAPGSEKQLAPFFNDTGISEPDALKGECGFTSPVSASAE